MECRKITSDAFCTTRQSAKGVLPSTSTVRSSTVGKGSRGAGVGCGRAGALPERMEPALAMAVLQCEQQRALAARHASGSTSHRLEDVQVLEKWGVLIRETRTREADGTTQKAFR